MSTTTYSAILASLVGALEARTPTNRTDTRFTRYPGDVVDFALWCDDMGEGAFRVFELQHAFNTQTVGPFDLLAYTVRHNVQLVVAYPQASLRYGATSDPRGDGLIHADALDLNAAMGQPMVPSRGASPWPAGLNDCQWVDTAVEDRPSVRLLRMNFLLTYQETNPP